MVTQEISCAKALPLQYHPITQLPDLSIAQSPNLTTSLSSRSLPWRNWISAEYSDGGDPGFGCGRRKRMRRSARFRPGETTTHWIARETLDLGFARSKIPTSSSASPDLSEVLW